MFGRISNLLIAGLIAGIFTMVISVVVAPQDFNCAMPVAHAAGASYLRQDNPVCRQSLQLFTVTLIDAGEGAQTDQETDPATYSYPGRLVFTDDQFVAVYRDGGTPHYERLAYASATDPSAVPEWIRTPTGTTIVPVRGVSEQIGIARAVANDASYWFHLGDEGLDRGHARIEGIAGDGVKSHLSVLGGQLATAEVQLISESTGGIGFSELHTITNTPLHLGANDTRRLTIEEDGDIGIGVEAPAVDLHVQNVNGGSMFRIQKTAATAGSWELGITAAGDFLIDDEGAAARRVTILRSNGDVGIGTAAPDSKLHVHGTTAGAVTAVASTILTLEDNGSTFQSFLTPDGSTSGTYYGDVSNNVMAAVLYDHNTDQLEFSTAGVADMAILDEVGLSIGGSVAPGALLHTQNAAGGSMIRMQKTNATAATWDFGITAAGDWLLDDTAGAVRRVTILKASGDTGIGTAAPDSKLHVFSATAGAVTAVANTVLTVESSATAYISILAPTESGLWFGDVAAASVGGIYYTHAADEMSFRTNSVRQWYIDSGGSFLAGTDDADDIGGAAGGRPQDVYIANDIKDVRLIHADQGNVPTVITCAGASLACRAVGAGSVIAASSTSMRGEFSVDVYVAGTDGDTIKLSYGDAFDAGGAGAAVPIVQLKSAPNDANEHMWISVSIYDSSTFTIQLHWETGVTKTTGAFVFVYQIIG